MRRRDGTIAIKGSFRHVDPGSAPEFVAFRPSRGPPERAETATARPAWSGNSRGKAGPGTTSTWLGTVDANWTTAETGTHPPWRRMIWCFRRRQRRTSRITTTSEHGIAYGALTHPGANYSIGGNSASFSSIDASQTTGTSTVSLPIDLTSAATVGVDNAAATLVMHGRDIRVGRSDQERRGNTQPDRPTIRTRAQTAINAGTLLVDGTQGSSPVTVASGATLGGNGTVTSITSTGGTVSPGDSARAAS